MKTNLRYSNICLRALTILCLMMASVGAWAQTYYVFQNGTYGYLVNNGTNNVGVNTTFSPSAVWIANNTLGNTSRNIRSYIDESKYMNGTTEGAFTLGSSSSVWRMANNYLQLRSGSSYYVKYSGTAFTMNNTANNGNRFTVYVVDDISTVNSSLSSFTISGGTDEMTATGSSPAFNHGTSTYTPQRTNYHFNNADHYVNGASATVSYTWSLSNMSGYATVSNAGVVTYSSLIPERERTVILTCTATAGGLTQTATKEITFVNPNMLYSPAISYINAAGGKVAVTLSYPESDSEVKLYYTTDGTTTPSSSSTLYTTPFVVDNNTTIKVIAINSTTTSAVVSEVVTNISSGVSGRKVVLYDYEDHNWTYYSGVEIGDYNTRNDYKGKLYSPNPRNVKITYLGKGKMRTGNDASNLIDVPEATRVSVGLGAESENIFVYYKTLERNANNRYEYTTIPNPFQVRPTYASDETTKWRGFQSWRIKSIKKGAIYSAATGGTALAAGDMLNAETAYYFVPTDADGTGYTPNCTSMEIELEAVWARAYVDNSTNVGYERNFRMITANSNAAPTTYTYPTTYTSVYPNGCTTETGSTLATGAQYRIGSAFTAASDTKFEYVILRNSTNNTTNATNTIDAACHNLVIGRGVVGYNGGLCATQIRGNAANSMDFMLRIESGSFTTFHALLNNGGTYSGICKVRSVLGCDYDRAKKDNSKLDISTNMWMGQSCKFSTAENRTQGFYKCWIKSGDLLSGVTVNGSNGTGGSEAFYYGTSGNQNSALHIFPRYVWMEGGQIAGLAGGLDDRSVTTDNEQRVYLRMTGGFVRGPIYGAGAYAVAAGRRNYILTGGEVGGWIAAGCNGIGNNTDQTNNGTTTGDSFVYVGGTVRVGYKGTTVNSVEGGNVFGAGRGAPVTAYDVGTVNNSNVVIADEAMIEKNVYGGGNYGFSKGEANIYITGGTVDGKVFGGSNMMKGDTPNMYMTGGLVKQGVYGGCNTEGTIAKNVTMNIVGGQVGTDGIQGNVHGGGLGNATVVSGKVDLTIGGTTPKQPVIYGNVYGGSESGDVNGNAYSATNTNTTKVTLNNGIINGSLYGGAWGRNREAMVYGPVTVTVNGGTVTEAVYGCNNAQGRPRLGVDVIINGTDPAPAEGQYALKNVFGGGNAANYTYTVNNKVYPTVTVNNCDNSIEYVYGGGNAATVPGTDVTIHGGNVIGNVFGGGYGANITTKGTKVTIDGGTILNVYGGSNSSGTITGGIVININEANETSCPINIDNVFGGGNRAASAAGSITIGCASHIGSVYGGANRANISGDINLSIVSGHIDNVFGGNNIEGDITGKITVTVNDNGSACGMLIGNVYGAGNLAAYNPTDKNFPVVNIQNGHLTGSVFGAGKGDPTDNTHAKGAVTGNPQVTIGANTGTVHIDGNVFGGGDAANVVGKPAVLVQNCSTVIGTKDGEGNWNAVGGTVYGGGNAADVTGAGNGTSVTINGGDINRVFGGGNGEVSPANVEGNAVTTIHAGNIHQAFAGSNMQGNISGSATITVDHSNEGCPELIDEVYGGGNLAAGNAGTVTIDCGANVGDVYGGANQADINSPITLNITGGTINRVFGGNNTSGNISGAITVNVNKSNTCDLDLNYVYGAGNQASYTPSTPGAYPAVNILKGTVKQDVFGGGLGATAIVTSNPTVTVNGGTVSGNVFGGGSEANTVGTTSVTVQAGTVSTDVYGGGALADVEGNTTVAVTGGTVAGNAYGGGLGRLEDAGAGITAVAAAVTGNTTVNVSGGTTNNVFGCNNFNGGPQGTVNVTISGGTVTNNVYGGGNLAAATANPIVTINGGTMQDVYGGGLGAPAVITGNTTITINKTAATMSVNNVFGGGSEANTVGNTSVTVQAGTVSTDVYGGGALADVEGNTTVAVTGGTVTGNAYGGGLGRLEDAGAGITAVAAAVTGNTTVNVSGGTTNNVFGCNNFNGGPQGTVNVTISGGNVTKNVYGGGNLAAATANPIVTINGGTMQDVYGGGLGAPAVITGNTTITINKTAATMSVNNVFGGGSAANVAGNTAITMTEGTVSNIYGGGEAANVVVGADETGKTVVTMNGGTVSHSIYGGGLGNTTNVATSTTVTANGGTVTEDVYGGSGFGKVGATTVTINNGATVTRDVFGGGFGQNADPGAGKEAYEADVTGNASVTINKGAVISGNVYGGNNTNGSPKGTITVLVDGPADAGEKAATPLNLNSVFGGGKNAATTSSTAPAVTIQGCETVIARVFGGGDAAAAPATNVTIWGGHITNAFGGGNGEVIAADVNGNVLLTVKGGQIVNTYGGSNTRGNITGEVRVVVDKDPSACDMNITNLYGGGNQAAGKAGILEVRCTGDNPAHKIANVYGGANAANVEGDVTLLISGGNIGNAFAGNNSSGTINGAIKVVVDWTGSTCGVNNLDNVYGGGNLAPYTTPDGMVGPTVQLINATINNNVYGGGYGAPAKVTGNPIVTLEGATVGTPTTIAAGTGGSIFGGGDAAPVEGNPTVTAMYGSAAKIFAGGKGSTAVVTGNPTAVLNKTDEQTLTITEIYGGGDAAEVTGNTTVTLTKGAVTNAFGGGNAAAINGNTLVTIANATASNVYGGGNLAGVTETATINMTGGNVTTGLYGGCNTSGTVTGEIAVNVTDGQVGTDAEHKANVHGGGYGPATQTAGNVAVAINGDDVVVFGDIYGGSAQGNVNDNTDDNTTVTITAGTINGDVYGGGLGDADYAALVNGTVQVAMTGGSVQNIFGCNNVNGSPQANVSVEITGDYATGYPVVWNGAYAGGNEADYIPAAEDAKTSISINGCYPQIGTTTGNSTDGWTYDGGVYGGGNAAAVPATDVTVNGGVISRVFGGGNGERGELYAAHVGYKTGTDHAPGDEYGSGKASVKVHGGEIGQVFGGSNSNGTIREGSTTKVDHSNTSCDENIREIYGGGNQADGTGGELEICGAIATDIYGGARNAAVDNDIVLTIKGGTYSNVFGGNNEGGNITGSITVNIEENDCTPIHINNLYGGGNLAAYSGTPSVNVLSWTSIANVFGGGYGSSAAVGGSDVKVNPTLPKVVEGAPDHHSGAIGSIFGGGNAAPVDGSTSVLVKGGTAAGQKVTVGGDYGYPAGHAPVLNGYIFGGGNQAPVNKVGGTKGNTVVTVTGNTEVTNNVYGGGNGGEVRGNTKVIIGE